jgi:hypothetical protein
MKAPRRPGANDANDTEHPFTMLGDASADHGAGKSTGATTAETSGAMASGPSDRARLMRCLSQLRHLRSLLLELKRRSLAAK